MSSGRLTRHIALFAGGAAIVGMGALTACSPPNEKEAPPSSTTTTPSSTVAPSPTEKKAVTPRRRELVLANGQPGAPGSGLQGNRRQQLHPVSQA